MKKLIILALSIAVFAGAFVLRARDGGEGSQALKDSAAIAADTSSEEASAANAPLPRLVDLGSDKCVPCKKMAPILESLSYEYRGSLRVEFIDVWKDTAAGEKWGVRVIPTQIFLDAAGEERFRHEGFYGRDEILAKWKELGVELKAVPAQT